MNQYLVCFLVETPSIPQDFVSLCHTPQQAVVYLVPYPAVDLPHTLHDTIIVYHTFLYLKSIFFLILPYFSVWAHIRHAISEFQYC